jgi:hypothetical protein
MKSDFRDHVNGIKSLIKDGYHAGFPIIKEWMHFNCEK